MELSALGRVAVLVMLASCAAQTSGTGFDEDSGSPATNDGGGSFGGDSGSPPPSYDSGSPPPYDSGSPPPCSSALIDDMEHGDGTIIKQCGRVGAWYTYNDATNGATQVPGAGTSFMPSPIVPPRGSSAHAARSTGNGFTGWGAGMGFDLNSQGAQSQKGTYDASAYTGFTFWARSGTGTASAIRFNVPDKDTDPSGGVCSPSSKCNDHYGVNLTLTDQWVQYTVKYGDLHQLGWGTVAPSFDAAHMIGVQVQLAPNATFDVWIDDISFVP
jgi:hypothetical protein